MKKNKVFTVFAILAMLAVSCSSNKTDYTTSTSSAFDMQKARAFIDSINTKFTEQFKNGDSAALASHYANDAEILFTGADPIKKADIISAWGGMLHKAMKDSTPNFVFTTTDLKGDSSFLIETGIYEFKDEHNTTKSKGRYVVIWEQENGEWKLYRDIGL